MAAALGHIEPFDETAESWEAYTERLGQYFIVNNVSEDMHVPALLSLVGGKTYGMLRDLTNPAKPATKSYKFLVDLLKEHLSPTPSVIAERFRFYKRDQKEGESISEYIAQLRKLSEHCDFGRALMDSLRDRLVCGLRSAAIQKRLLSERKLDFDQARQISIAMETASRDAVELQDRNRNTGSGAIHKVQAHQAQKYGKKPEKPVYKPQKKKTSKTCFRCLRTGHDEQNCFYKNEKCRKCGEVGHIQKACVSFHKKHPNVHGLDEESQAATYTVENEDDFDLFSVNSSKGNVEPFWVEPVVNGKVLKMELDTGAAVSVIHRKDFRKHFGNAHLCATKKKLKTYSGETVHPVGMTDVFVELNGQNRYLPLYVVEQGGPPLFGRDWLQAIRLDWAQIHAVKGTSITRTAVDDLVNKYSDVFSPELGTLKGVKAKLTVKEGAQPKFLKARPVPFSLRPAVEREIDRLVDIGVLTPVERSEYATPIVVVPKKDGTVRICGDFKATLNDQLVVDQYPLPKIDDIFANLSGGERFTKLDLKNAYMQMEVEESQRDMLTINTHRGLFRYNRLIYGISSAPAIWQRTMEQVLQGLSGVQCILDDMIITGNSDDNHLENLEAVLMRLQKNGLKANIDKCDIFKEKIDFCGHTIDEKGLHKTPSKVEAVRKAPVPENVTQLRSFLGLVNYYSKFLENLATVLRPLHRLLEKDVVWDWSENCQRSFEKVKDMVSSDKVLTHYDPKLPVVLSCDASPSGLGVVLSHEMPNGDERPIAYASRTLSPAEKNYSQIDKEALAIIWGIKHFNVYLYGRQFTIITDHQPLVSIFNPSKATSATMAARMQRYSVFLSGYMYSIRYKSTKLHGNADSLSRLPLEGRQCDMSVVDETHIFQLSQMETLPVTSEVIAKETARDPVLSRVLRAVTDGWSWTDKNLTQFYEKRHEITVQNNVLFWGIRVIIPSKLQEKILQELHQGHTGMVKMKSLARSHLWWPGVDFDIEKSTKQCLGCQVTRNEPKEAPVHPWEFPSKPWQRIHVDFAGPFMNSMFLVVVDAHSKWPEVIQMGSTTTSKTIDALRSIFARYGLPEHLVSDNGPQFTSAEFAEFMQSNGILHLRSAPFHPRTNGLAERFVQTFKQAMKSAVKDDGSLQQKLQRFLLSYRNTPQSTTAETPSSLLMGRKLRTRLDLLRPNVSGRVMKAQARMMGEGDMRKSRDFSSGDSVLVRDYRGDCKWAPGVIQSKTGPVSYTVEMASGQIWRRHADQVIGSVPDKISRDPSSEINSPNPESFVVPVAQQSVNAQSTQAVESPRKQTPARPTPPVQAEQVVHERRYPIRNRKTTKRLDL